MVKKKRVVIASKRKKAKSGSKRKGDEEGKTFDELFPPCCESPTLQAIRGIVLEGRRRARIINAERSSSQSQEARIFSKGVSGVFFVPDHAGFLNPVRSRQEAAQIFIASRDTTRDIGS